MTDDFIERGFQSFLGFALSGDVPEQQIEDMRRIFFAGVTHLHRAILDTSDEQFEGFAASINTEIAAFLSERQPRKPN
jgi:hypothetical protein